MKPSDLTQLLTADHFAALARVYRRKWSADLVGVDTLGAIVFGRSPCKRGGCESCCQMRVHALAESKRWGEPTIGACNGKRLIWAVPLMQNQKVLGALVASVTERRALAQATPETKRTGAKTSNSKKRARAFDVRQACRELRELAQEENLTNTAALAARRKSYLAEQDKAYAIHALKERAHTNIRDLYIRDEADLFSAIRAGDRRGAREILNRVLLAIARSSGDRIDLTKSFFLELVASMNRTAVASGVSPERLLGNSYVSMTELAEIDSEEVLTPWLVEVLDRLMDEVHSVSHSDTSVRLLDAIAFIQTHASEKITRNDAARASQLSPAHFSVLLHEKLGITFTGFLNRLRVSRASELLSSTDMQLSMIAIDCGFSDQSYFTKVFKKHRGLRPLEYRQRADLND